MTAAGKPSSPLPSAPIAMSYTRLSVPSGRAMPKGAEGVEPLADRREPDDRVDDVAVDPVGQMPIPFRPQREKITLGRKRMWSPPVTMCAAPMLRYAIMCTRHPLSDMDPVAQPDAAGEGRQKHAQDCAQDTRRTPRVVQRADAPATTARIVPPRRGALADCPGHRRATALRPKPRNSRSPITLPMSAPLVGRSGARLGLDAIVHAMAGNAVIGVAGLLTPRPEPDRLHRPMSTQV